MGFLKILKPFYSIVVCLFEKEAVHNLIISYVIKQVDESICKFAKKGLTPSQIGVILRDSHGIPQVKSVTGNKILRILKAHGLCSNTDHISYLYEHKWET